jgi:hypothetical protein
MIFHIKKYFLCYLIYLILQKFKIMTKTKSNRGRKPVDPQEKKKALVFYVPTKNHEAAKSSCERVIKKYLK